jgi:hypothetical protein
MTIKAAIAKGPASLLPKGFRLCKVVRNSELLQVQQLTGMYTLYILANTYMLVYCDTVLLCYAVQLSNTVLQFCSA